MFQITFKILNWIRPYKARMILGFSMSFLMLFLLRYLSF